MVDIADPPPEFDVVEIAKKQKVGTVVAAAEDKPKKEKRSLNELRTNVIIALAFLIWLVFLPVPLETIIQIDPRALFRRDGGYIDRADKYFDSAPFENGLAHTLRFWRKIYAGVVYRCGSVHAPGVLEYGSRKFAPELSLMSAFGLSDASELVYSSAKGMGRVMGYIGAVMMFVAALYTLRLNIPGIRRLGNARPGSIYTLFLALPDQSLACCTWTLKSSKCTGSPY